MATDPYAGIRNLQFTPTYTVLANLGGGNRVNETFTDKAAAEARKAELGGNAVLNEFFNPDESALQAGGFNTKYGSGSMMQDGKLLVNLQQPGAHKYDTMDAIYEKDPATGQWVLKNDPMQYQTRQQSSASNLGQAIGTGAALFGGAAFGPALAGALGGGALGGAGAGAIIGGGGALASGANSDEALRGALAGGIAGGIGGYMQDAYPQASYSNEGRNYMNPSSTQGIGGSPINATSALAEQMGTIAPSSPASAVGSASGAFPPAGSWAPLDDYYRGGGASDMATGGQFAGEGGHPFAVGADAGVDYGNLYGAGLQPVNAAPGSQQIEVVGDRLPTSSAVSANPGAMIPMLPIMPEQLSPGISTPDPQQPMPEANPGQQPSAGGKFMDFLKNNPRLALTMLGMLGSGGGGGNNQSPGVGAGGAQNNITATQAPKFQRQYVAPPEGYRPGFDPEHKYFTGIGSTGG